MTEYQERPSLKWIATGLATCFVLGGIAFYSFSSDIRQIDPTYHSRGSLHRR
jgi:hypothetical protein